MSHRTGQHDGGEQGDPSCRCSSVWLSTTRWLKSTRPHSDLLRLVESQVVHDGRDPRSVPAEDGRIGAGSVESGRHQDSWYSCRQRKIRSEVERRTDCQRGTIVTRDPLCAGSASGWRPMCQTRCQHLFHQEVATKPVGTLGHDTGMWEAIAKAIATLPMRGGGLGLRSASMAPATSARSHQLGHRPALQWSESRRISEGVGFGVRTFGQTRFCGSTELGKHTTGTSPTRHCFSRARRVATWLATQHVFLFRVPLSGDRDVCPVVRRQSHPRSHSGSRAKETCSTFLRQTTFCAGRAIEVPAMGLPRVF